MTKSNRVNKNSTKSVEKKYISYLIKFALPAAVIGIMAGYGLSQFLNKPANKVGPSIMEDLSLYQLKETRPTLSPALFKGKIAWAYQVALEIPKVLDQLYCYCKCDENFGHRSLLSCYVGQHGAN
jgi:hypothetical protein